MAFPFRLGRRSAVAVLSAEKWPNDNLAGRERPLVLSLRIRTDIGQARPTDHTSNAAALATAWMRSPRGAFESICAGCGATQAEIDTRHLRREPVSQAINGLYRQPEAAAE
jgi:hypothetical protein